MIGVDLLLTSITASRRSIVRFLSCVLIATQLTPASSETPSKSPVVLPDRPLSGAAYRWADAAYKAYSANDFTKAVEFARKAARRRPDIARLRELVSTAEAARDARAQASAVAVAPQIAPSATKADEQMLEKVYSQISSGERESAVSTAQDLLLRYPDDPRVWQSLINALAAAGRLIDADKLISQASAKFGLDDELLVLRESVRRQAGEAEVKNVFRSLERGDVDAAAQFARNSIVYAPDIMDNRLLLTYVLLNAGRYEEAERAANDAVNVDPDDVMPHMLRGYARQYLGRRDGALEDFEIVLRAENLASFEQKFYRLIMADAALAAQDPQAALNLMQFLNDDPGTEVVALRRRAAMAQMSAESRHAAVAFETLRQLSFDCRATPYGRECLLVPASPPADPAYILANEAYLALQAKDAARALSKAREALRLDRENASYQRLVLNMLIYNDKHDEAGLVADEVLRRGPPSAELLVLRGNIRLKLGQEILAQEDYDAALAMEKLPFSQAVQLLAKVGRKEEAKQRLEQEFKSGERATMATLEWAYLAIGIGADEIAGEIFERVDQSQKLNYGSLQDAAYTSMRTGHDERAMGYLKRAADMGYLNLAPHTRSANLETLATQSQQENAGLRWEDYVVPSRRIVRVTLQKDVETGLGLQASNDLESLLGIRRNIAELSRQWGATVSLSYRGVSSPLAWNGAADDVYSQNVQLGTELYWRPFGYRNGKLFEVYARAMGAPYSSNGGLTGSESLQGSVGVRWKPLENQNVMLALNRVFPLGSHLANDWLVQALYSGGDGGQQPRADIDAWWTTQYYAEVGRYSGQGQTFASANARLGRSFQLDSFGANVVATPHLVAAADYSSAYVQPNAVGTGLGVNLRYGYRQDQYHATRSYIDLLLQYRAAVAGDEQRARGFFLTLFSSY